MNTKMPFVFCALLIGLTGCNRNESDWKSAKQANTLPAYADFLRKHPHGTHADEAQKVVEEAQAKENDWSDALKINTVAAYADFLGKYPDGPHLNEVKKAIEESLTREKHDYMEVLDALWSGKPSNIDNFCFKYPKSKYLITDKSAQLSFKSDISFSLGSFMQSGPTKWERDEKVHVKIEVTSGEIYEDDIPLEEAKKKGVISGVYLNCLILPQPVTTIFAPCDCLFLRMPNKSLTLIKCAIH